MKNPVKPTPDELEQRPDAPMTADGFFADGPTLKEYIAAGYKEENYPPDGYAPNQDPTPGGDENKTVAPKRKFYHAMNSNQAKTSGRFQFNFSPYFHGPCWMGTYTTDKPEEIAALDALVKQPGYKNQGVTEMTEEEWHKAQGEKKRTLNGLGQSLIHSEAALQSGSHPSAKLAEEPNTEPAQPAPAKPETAENLTLGETSMPGAEGSESGA